MKLITILIAIHLFHFAALNAQTDNTKKFTFSMYGDAYYTHDFSNPIQREKSNFIYNHKRNQELNVNLLFLKAQYASKRFRANAGMMTGNYARYNLSSEPNWARYVYESNIGLRLSTSKNIWLDAGVMPSHIGFESVISADCWTLTRSILAENSPYYESGIRASYTSPNEKLLLAVFILNGWQRINPEGIVRRPSIGFQATMKKSSEMTLHYANFIGQYHHDTIQTFRHFHNFFLQFESTGPWGLIGGFDIGQEKQQSGKFNTWYSPIIIIRRKAGKKVVLALRAEYFHDRKEIIIPTGTSNGFETLGISSNIDFNLHENIKIRMEGKLYQSKDNLFDQGSSRQNYSLTTNVTLKL